MRSLRAVFLFGLMTMGPLGMGVSAQLLNEALTLYSEGEYAEAMSLGEAEGGSDGFTIAARAARADAELRDMPCLECLLRAEEFARLAIAADDENAEAYILLVTALGRRAQLIGFFASQREAIASQTDDAITTALELNPAFSFALAVRGAWHIEIVNQAGRLLARILYGANIEDGRDFYRQAIEIEPENPVIRYQYALSLEGYDFERERRDIEAALAAALSGDPRNAYEEAIQERAQILFDLLSAGEEDAFRQRMNQFRGDL